MNQTQPPERIIFLMNPNTKTFDKSFYNPFFTAHKLTLGEVNTILSQIDYLYRESKSIKPQNYVLGFCTAIFISLYVENQKLAWQGMSPRATAVGVGILSFAGIGYAIWKRAQIRAEKDAYELIDQANRIYLPKGFRWHLPNGFERIELCSDYKYFTSHKAINDDN